MSHREFTRSIRQLKSLVATKHQALILRKLAKLDARLRTQSSQAARKQTIQDMTDEYEIFLSSLGSMPPIKERRYARS